MKGGLRIAVTLIALAPFSFIVTFLLFPFWDWIETTFGIEAVGHAMVQEWCFGVTYVFCVMIFIALRAYKKTKVRSM